MYLFIRVSNIFAAKCDLNFYSINKNKREREARKIKPLV